MKNVNEEYILAYLIFILHSTFFILHFGKADILHLAIARIDNRLCRFITTKHNE